MRARLESFVEEQNHVIARNRQRHARNVRQIQRGYGPRAQTRLRQGLTALALLALSILGALWFAASHL